MIQSVVATILDNGNLRFTLLPEGKTNLLEVKESKSEEYLHTDACLWDVLEYQLCNGYESLEPEEIGALTDAPIIAEGVSRHSDGNAIIGIGNVWAFMDYQIKSPVLELLNNGFVDFVHVE